MKTSIYNTYLPLGSQAALLYNALSDKYVALRAPLPPETIGHLEEIADGALLKQLTDIGAVVPDGVNEPEQVRELIRTYDHGSDVFQLHINPTLDCNFRCWYCYEDHRAGSRMEGQTVQSVIKLMERVVAERPGLKYFPLSFFGGEPLMGFDNVARPVILALEGLCAGKEIRTSVHFTTNAFLINERMLDFFSTHKASFQITLDGHREFHDKVRRTRAGLGSYDRILYNIRELAKRGCEVLVRVNFTRENMGSIPAIIEDFKAFPPELKGNMRFDLQRVWQDSDRSIEEEVTATVAGYQRALREAGLGISIYMAHDAVRNSCYGDKRNYLLVNYDGGVYLCTARDFDDAHRAGTLQEDGTVAWRDNAHECRLAAKFSKPVCHTCRIAPICGGGCCTQALEHPEPDKCIYGYTEEQKDAMVANRFEQLYMVPKE